MAIFTVTICIIAAPTCRVICATGSLQFETGIEQFQIQVTVSTKAETAPVIFYSGLYPVIIQFTVLGQCIFKSRTGYFTGDLYRIVTFVFGIAKNTIFRSACTAPPANLHFVFKCPFACRDFFRWWWSHGKAINI